MSAGLSYTRSRGGVRRSSRRRRASRRSNGASLTWSAGWVDPAIVLSPGSTGSAEVIPNSEVRDTGENLTLVGGFMQASGGVFNIDDSSNSGGYLIMGLRVLPATIVDVAEMPDPFNESDGDWLWYRTFPLIDRAPGQWDQSNSFAINDQIRSARRIAQDEEVSLHYTWLDADVGAADAYVRFLASWRLLLRAP